MKYLKILAVAVTAMFAFEGAQAQVIIKAHIGAPVHRVYPRRTVVVSRRPVVVTRPVVVSRPVYRRPYRRVVVTRPVYHKRVVIRHY